MEITAVTDDSLCTKALSCSLARSGRPVSESLTATVSKAA